MRAKALLVWFTMAFATAATGCFDKPNPDCAFSCGVGGTCPAGYRCSLNGWCVRNDLPQSTTCSPAPLDAAVIDAPPGRIDGSVIDGSVIDGSVIDGSVIDAMPADAMPADAMPADAMPADAMPADASVSDASTPDASPADASLADASVPDSGSTPDGPIT